MPDGAIAIYLMITGLKGVSSMELHRDLDVTQETAWHLAMRIRETFEDDGVAFARPVGVDETYMGDNTNRIKSFWSLLKRGYHGIYHKINAKHLGRYVNEFSGRHKARSKDTLDQMAGIAYRMSRRRLSYAHLTASENKDTTQGGSDVF